jgi:hypothetical protein
MLWVTWRQHRNQAILCFGVCVAAAVVAVAFGEPMRTAFSNDGLPTCLARSGGTGCPGAISEFASRFNGPAQAVIYAPLFVIPGLVGIVVGGQLLGRELEQGTWRLAWSQTVPRTRWLVTQLSLVTGGLVVFGAVITAVMTWYHEPLDRVTTRLQPPPFNFEGITFTASLLCAFGLALLAGLLLRRAIAAMVAGYVVWELVSVVVILIDGPINIPGPVTMRIPCHAGCPGASTNSVPPVTGHLGDLVLGVTRGGNQLIVSYLPASRFWTSQFIAGGLLLAVAAAALATALWLLHRRTT